MARLAFCDYHNMIAILEKYEHNVDFHPIVDFVEASYIRRNLKLKDEAGISSLPDAELFENLTLIGRARIAQSSALFTAADKPAYPLGDDSQGEACPTVSGLEAKQDMANIIKSSTLPHDSTPRVTSLAADEGTQDLEIASLKARIKMLEDKNEGVAKPSRDDATIKGRSLKTGDEACVDKSIERGSNDTEELVNVLTSLDAANILTSGGVKVVSIPPAIEVSTVSVPTGSGMIDVQVAREMEEQIAREDQRMNEQVARDAKIARIHAEEELQMLIDSLDRNNETVAKYLQEYEQFAANFSIEERIELINDLVKYQDIYAKVLKYQSQQRKPLSKKQQREFYMSIKDFVPMGSKEEGERFKRKGLRLEHECAKKVKTLEEVSEEDLKIMMQLVPVKEVYVEALQVKHPIIDWEIHIEGKRTYWKIIRLGGNTVVYQILCRHAEAL
nr:hypothetical protein [Tanacetum cinerariifolium]